MTKMSQYSQFQQFSATSSLVIAHLVIHTGTLIILYEYSSTLCALRTNFCCICCDIELWNFSWASRNFLIEC